MFDDFDKPVEVLGEEQAFDLLRELERNTPEEIRRQRAHFRVGVRANVTLQSGNASELLDFKVQGVTGDVSESGIGLLAPLPMRVGDVYRLTFDRDKLDLPVTFARCVRCRLVREGAFESGFVFFAPIGLPANLAAAAR